MNQSTDKTAQILKTLAVSHPDFIAFQRDAAKALIPANALPNELLQDTLTLLRKDPQQATVIDALQAQPADARGFFPGSDVALLVAIAFLLRTHIKIERTTTGKWKWLIEHKPGDSKLMTILLNKLETFLGQ